MKNVKLTIDNWRFTFYDWRFNKPFSHSTI